MMPDRIVCYLGRHLRGGWLMRGRVCSPAGYLRGGRLFRGSRRCPFSLSMLEFYCIRLRYLTTLLLSWSVVFG